MRILHLAYEDPRMPGAGGGSVRSREINRRVGTRHDITAIVAGYRGAEAWDEDGVHWIPIGPKASPSIGRLAYFPLVAREIARRPHDLIIDDFGAPFGPTCSPWFANRPVIASVQWLFANEMRAKYHFPFDWVERFGIQRYQRFISVSSWLSAKISAQVPTANIAMIPNGIEPIAFAIREASAAHFLYVGRLERAQKGIDMLLPTYARVRQLLGTLTPPLVIAGEGPDRAWMEASIQTLDLADSVRFVGQTTGEQKFDLIARSYAVLMPSRYETFGMVAVEALAAGAPVVTFDVGPLREVTGGHAYLIHPFEEDCFATTAASLVVDPLERGSSRQKGRDWARRYDWDSIANDQEACYQQAVT